MQLHNSGVTEGLQRYWLPFTANRYFKQNPKLLASAKGAYFTMTDGRRLFDCLSGLWCCPLGHGHPHIAEALKRQAESLDYSTAFQISNPVTLSFAARVSAMAPAGLGQVFFTNSGSESVDTAIKIAVGYHRVRGEGQRFRIIGRERGYHGVGIGGISVGGMVANRKMFAPLMMPGVDHLPHTYSHADMAFSRGQPTWGAHLADDLERLVALHDAATIAAVIVEPMAGSTGVVVPPVGYLEKLRQICTKHGILLIFDEVICGFGRLGENFGAQRLGVTPGPSHLRQGRHQRHHPDGRRAGDERDLRSLHERPGRGGGVLPRLHLLRSSDGVRRRPRHARHHGEGRPHRPRPRARTCA